MGFRAGIVGLPNVGKSTLFNALSRAQALVANYPFATVDPNIARVPVPDPRLKTLGEISGSAALVPATLDLMDIAGLVRGASKGEGLGNQFLAHIREVDAVVEVVRAFKSPEIVHVEGEVQPRRDLEIIETELILSDLEYLERRREKLRTKLKGDPGVAGELELLEATRNLLNEGQLPARIPPELLAYGRGQGLLSFKPFLLVVNLAEEDLARPDPVPPEVKEYAEKRNLEVIPICAKIEAELATLPPEEQELFLKELGIQESGLHRLIRTGYRLLGLLTFFTTGAKETRAWTIPRGTLAPQAAGKIHSDFERGFIRAEVVSYEDFVTLGGWGGARQHGKVRLEGKDYPVAEGDVIHFRFAV